LYRRPAAAGEPDLFNLTLPAEPQAWLDRLAGEASPDRRARAARYRQPMDALRCLAAEALLHHAVREVAGIGPAALAIERNAHGKPAFVNHPELHFNLSHSGRQILCALHDGPVGVDVEAPSAHAPQAAEAFMSEQEWLRFQRLRGAPRSAEFFRLWTLKESLLKAAGTGLSHDPRLFSIDPQGHLSGHPPPPPHAKQWRLQPLPLPPPAAAALCDASDAS
jgi:4'-phosphopantetheinyl transferase